MCIASFLITSTGYVAVPTCLPIHILLRRPQMNYRDNESSVCAVAFTFSYTQSTDSCFVLWHHHIRDFGVKDGRIYYLCIVHDVKNDL